MKPLETDIPKYISTFDLEMARLGQALQKLQLEGSMTRAEADFFFQEIARILKEESTNVEWAIGKSTNKKALEKRALVLNHLMKIIS